MISGPRGAHLAQVSRVPVPFESLAPYIIEPGFTVSRDQMHKLENYSEQVRVKEVADFQYETEDIIEEEVQRRERLADPSIISKGKDDNSN
jgi:hypothetical protein